MYQIASAPVVWCCQYRSAWPSLLPAALPTMCQFVSATRLDLHMTSIAAGRTEERQIGRRPRLLEPLPDVITGLTVEIQCGRLCARSVDPDEECGEADQYQDVPARDGVGHGGVV
jgi:hypothetical protein